MFERFARNARTAVEQARDEAVRRGDTRIGSDHLLIALLGDADLAATAGADAAAARAAADRLDQNALAAIGLPVTDLPPARSAPARRHVGHLTSGARAVIQQSLSRATAEKARTITARHLMLAVLDRPDPDPAAALIGALAIDRGALSERLSRPSGGTTRT